VPKKSKVNETDRQIAEAEEQAECVARAYGFSDGKVALLILDAGDDKYVHTVLDTRMRQVRLLPENATRLSERSVINRFVRERLPMLTQMSGRDARAALKKEALNHLELLAPHYQCCRELLADRPGAHLLSERERSDQHDKLSRLLRAAHRSVKK
jgi:hypothetical protein